MKMPCLTDMKREDFDNYVIRHANAFSCSVFEGRGEWRHGYFLTLDEAKAAKQKVLAAEPRAKIMIRALVVDENGPQHSAMVTA